MSNSLINSNNISKLKEGINPALGQRVVKIGDYYFPVGVGGNYTVAGGIPVYECTAVDSEESTWQGKLVSSITGEYINTGDAEVTLTFSGVVPVVGRIYTADAGMMLQSSSDQPGVGSVSLQVTGDAAEIVDGNLILS